MLDQYLFNRRFVRIKAVQRLYAFYVCKQANYYWALDQIRADFTPPVFTDSPVDKALLDQKIKKALDLFSSSLATSPIHASNNTPEIPVDNQVSIVVYQVLNYYEKELAKDRLQLEQGWAKAIATINQNCVLIWQLLIEWLRMVQRQTDGAQACLVDSHWLPYLQQDSNWAKLIQQDSTSWKDQKDLVKSWYNQFIKKDPIIQRYLGEHTDSFREKQLLSLLVERIVFGQGCIQDFFAEIDLSWDTHKRYVKKLVYQSIAKSYEQSSKKTPNTEHIGSADRWEAAQNFYSSLVIKTLQKEKELEALIIQKSENWAIERIIILDKAIIKLALCELMYFPDIPTKVSINEYIAIAKIYGSPKSGQFVNGLLDSISSEIG